MWGSSKAGMESGGAEQTAETSNGKCSSPLTLSRGLGDTMIIVSPVVLVSLPSPSLPDNRAAYGARRRP